MNAACPICGHSASSEFFRARHQPAMLNRLLGSRAEALAVRTVDLHFRRCDDWSSCGFVWNAGFDPESVAYVPGYNNDQSQSSAFRAHLDDVRARLATIVQLTDGDILEIGCGQGEFLRQVCSLTDRSGIGFDPAYVKNAADRHSSVCIHQLFFDEHAGERIRGSVGAIICRHVLEHLPNPMRVLRQAASMLEPGGALYIEVPCIEWIARLGAFHDLFNEHCSLFSPRSLHRALQIAGFAQVRINRAFGDQYLAAEARLSPRIDSFDDAATEVMDTDGMRGLLEESKRMVAFEMHSDTGAKPCLIWGAGAKGVSLVNHLQLDSLRVAALIDIHPLKCGRFVPGTGQPVIGPTEIPRMANGEVPRIVVMNPNYLDEVRRTLNELQIDADACAMNGRLPVALHR